MTDPRKARGGRKREDPARSGGGSAEVGGSAKDPKPDDGAPALSAPYLVGETSIPTPLGEVPVPVLYQAAKIAPPDDRGTPRQARLPVYGNYCGLGHGDPTFRTPPVDAVDAVCREHDRCYDLLGDFDGRCDRRLIEAMPNAIASTPSPQGKNVGLLALLYFSLAERNLALGKTLFKRT